MKLDENIRKKNGVKDENSNGDTKTKRALSLDIEYYQSLLDDTEIPEDQKRELVETLWSIVVNFIDLGFEVHPLQQISEDNAASGESALRRLIEETSGELLTEGQGNSEHQEQV